MKSVIEKMPSKFVLFILGVNSECNQATPGLDCLPSTPYAGMRGHFNQFRFSWEPSHHVLFQTVANTINLMLIFLHNAQFLIIDCSSL